MSCHLNCQAHLELVQASDAQALLEIYAPYVQNTAITFEYEVPSKEEFRSRIEHTLESYPYIKAVCEDKIVGYAYASVFKPRKAYEYCVETSIYIAQDMRGKRVGSLLYKGLEALLQAQGVLNLNACIAYDATHGSDPYLDNSSVHFHQRIGYEQCARFRTCGYKFGRWYDMVWMEKMLGEHPENPAPFMPFSNLDATVIDALLERSKLQFY